MAEPWPGPWRQLRPYRAKILAGVVCLVAVAGFQQAIPWLLKLAIDDLRAGAAHVAPLALGMIGCAAAQAGIRVLSRLFHFDVARRAEYDLRNRLFQQLLTLPPSFYRRARTGDLMSRLTADLTSLRQMWGPGLLNAVNTVCQYAAALTLMLSISPQLTAWALLPYPLLAVATGTFARRMGRLSREAQEQMGVVAAAAQEDLAGIGVVKSYGLEPARREELRRRSERLLDVNVKLAVTRGQMMPMVGALGAIGTVLVLWRGGTMVQAGALSLGELIAFNAYVGLLIWPTLALGWIVAVFQRGAACYRRVRELGEEPAGIVDGAQPAPAGPVRGELGFDGLTVEAGGRRLLDDVRFRVPAGATCALVGRTGAGKTTLVEALARLVEIPAGQVRLDGHDITAHPLGWTRGAIGYAPQEAFLFSATIAENIAFGRRVEESEAERRAAVARAAAAAGLERDLAALPDGLETVVGERGITLSGGQRQRVALARALAAEPRVLILDDSLSSVDAHTEREILDRLAHERRGRTVMLITHRTAIMAEADLVVVLDEGRVVEVGTHEELLRAGGVYAQLYKEERQKEEAA